MQITNEYLKQFHGYLSILLKITQMQKSITNFFQEVGTNDTKKK